MAGRQRGFRAHANTVEALQAGRARWLERQRLLKAAGLIKKIPGGRKKGASGRARSKNPTVARAQRLVERMIEVAKRNPIPHVPATADTTAAPSKAERLSAAADSALEIAQQILNAPVDLENIKLARLQLDAALGIIARALQADSAAMRRDADRQNWAITEIQRRLQVDAAAPPPPAPPVPLDAPPPKTRRKP